MVLVHGLPGVAQQFPGKPLNDDQYTPENAACNGWTMSEVFSPDHVLQQLEPKNATEECGGTNCTTRNDDKICLADHDNNYLLWQPGTGFAPSTSLENGDAMVENVHNVCGIGMIIPGEEKAEMFKRLKFQAHFDDGSKSKRSDLTCGESVGCVKGKGLRSLEGKYCGIGQNEESRVQMDNNVSEGKSGETDFTCEMYEYDCGKNGHNEIGGQMAMVEEELSERKENVPHLVMDHDMDLAARISDEAKRDDHRDGDDDAGNEPNDDGGGGGGGGGGVDDGVCIRMLNEIGSHHDETDYGSDATIDCCDDDSLVGGDDDDVGDGDDDDEEEEEDDDDTSVSDIDVQSFLAQLDEEIAGTENNNPAIDTGYAWIVVFAVFLIHTLLLGYLKSGGVFFVEFQRQFHSTASMTSLIIGLVEGIFSISAPFVLGFMVKVWSVRQLCLVGSFIFVVGVVCNAFCDRVEYLLLTHSVCFGLANGLIYGPSIYLINEYFHKRKALALSIATTGASVGGIIFPLLVRFLFDTYGYAGGIVMTAGVLMQIFIGAVLLVPFEHHEINYYRHNQNKVPSSHNHRNNHINVAETNLNAFGSSKTSKSKDKLGLSILDTLKQRWKNWNRNGGSSKINSSVANMAGSRTKSKTSINKSNSSIFQKHQTHQSHHTFQVPNSSSSSQHKSYLGSAAIKPLQLEQFSSKLEICEEGVPLEIQSDHHTTTDNPEHAKDSVSEKKLHLSIPGRFPHYNFVSDNTSLSSTHSHLSNRSVCSSAHHGSSRNRLDIIYLGSNANELGLFPSHASNLVLMSKASSSKQTLSRSIMFQSTSTLNNTIADIISIDQEFKRLPTMQSPENNEGRNVSTFRRMIPRFCDSPLLKSASFWLLVPYYFCGAIGVGLSQIYILPFAKERGLTDDQAAFCLSLLNMLDIIAHLVPGIILNFGFMTSNSVAILPMAVVAIVGHLTPFFHSYESVIAMAAAFGLSMGFFYALHSLIVIDTLGLDNYSSSMGIYYLVCGAAGAVSYPIAGALKDHTGSYTSTYQYLASMQLVSVAILVVLPLVKRFDVRRGVLKAP